MIAINSFIDIIKTNIKYKKQTLTMAKLTLKKTYSGSGLGILWALVQPTVYIFMYWFMMEVGLRGAGSNIGADVPYLFWLISGLMPWFFIRDCFNGGTNVFTKDKHLITKVVFPVSTIPIYNVMANFFAHGIMMVIVLIILNVGGCPIDIYYLQFFYYIPFLIYFCCVLSTFVGTLSVISKDFKHMIKSIVMVFFWMSPILWPATRLEGTWTLRILKINPFYYFIQGYRNTVIYHKWFWETPVHTAYILIFTVIFTLVTAYLYGKLHDEFADVL